MFALAGSLPARQRRHVRGNGGRYHGRGNSHPFWHRREPPRRTDAELGPPCAAHVPCRMCLPACSAPRPAPPRSDRAASAVRSREPRRVLGNMAMPLDHDGAWLSLWPDEQRGGRPAPGGPRGGGGEGWPRRRPGQWASEGARGHERPTPRSISCWAGADVGVLSLRGWRFDRTWALLGAGFLVLTVADSIVLLQVAANSSSSSQVANLFYGPAALIAFRGCGSAGEGKARTEGHPARPRRVFASRPSRCWGMTTLPASASHRPRGGGRTALAFRDRQTFNETPRAPDHQPGRQDRSRRATVTQRMGVPVATRPLRSRDTLRTLLGDQRAPGGCGSAPAPGAGGGGGTLERPALAIADRSGEAARRAPGGGLRSPRRERRARAPSPCTRPRPHTPGRTRPSARTLSSPWPARELTPRTGDATGGCPLGHHHRRLVVPDLAQARPVALAHGASPTCSTSICRGNLPGAHPGRRAADRGDRERSSYPVARRSRSGGPASSDDWTSTARPPGRRQTTARSRRHGRAADSAWSTPPAPARRGRRGRRGRRHLAPAAGAVLRPGRCSARVAHRHPWSEGRNAGRGPRRAGRLADGRAAAASRGVRGGLREPVAAAQRPGVMPYARLKWRVMWLWSAKPAVARHRRAPRPRRSRARATSRRRMVR